MAGVRLRGVHKRFGKVHAVRGVDIEIPDRAFTVLVGPSGCGKSTLLRMIAGLEEVTEGTVEIEGAVVNDIRPKDRDVAMVFQNYALYPHMSVFENVAFGLRMRNAPNSEIRPRVERAATMLGIADLLERQPRQLSGGQRQRVAMGRALVRDAKLYLFDEPLSNLDAQLRDEMRTEIKRLHQDMQRTMIYVTHDQVEAMTLADRIVLLRDGQIEQEGAAARALRAAADPLRRGLHRLAGHEFRERPDRGGGRRGLGAGRRERLRPAGGARGALRRRWRPRRAARHQARAHVPGRGRGGAAGLRAARIPRSRSSSPWAPTRWSTSTWARHRCWCAWKAPPASSRGTPSRSTWTWTGPCSSIPRASA